MQHRFYGVRPPSLSLRGGQRPTWRPEREARGSALGVQSRSTRLDHRALPANTVTLRGGASRTPPPTRRVRSTIVHGNLQLPKALTERRYIFLSRSGLVQRAPLQTQLVFTFLSVACANRQYSAGRDMSLPSLSKKSLRAFFAKLLSELQNLILYHYFAILPLRRVIERERKP